MIQLHISTVARIATVNIRHGAAVYSRAIVHDMQTRKTLRAPWVANHGEQISVGKVDVPTPVMAEYEGLQDRAYDLAEGLAN